MEEQETSSSSWLLRTHFSRAICYRPGTCNSLISLAAKDIVFCAKEKKTKDAQHGASLCIRKTEHLGRKPNENFGARDETEGAEFSFASPISSSAMSRLSDSSVHSKSTLDSFSPFSDDDVGPGVSMAAVPTCPGSSPGFLCSVLNSLSISSSSRWSVSSGSFNNNQAHSCSSSFGGSWSSPATSPRTSFRYSTSTRDTTDNIPPIGPPKANFNFSSSDGPLLDQGATLHGNGSDMSRVPSWSHHLSNAGNESAVLSAEKWMVDLSLLLLGERFACGNHSRLYRGIYKDGHVAVKIIRQPDEDGALADRLEHIFANEVNTLSCLQHRNIVKFIAACKKPPVLCVITEYLSGGSLRSFLHKREGKLLPLSQVLRMALNVACGMEYLHMKGVIHRDLKSENLALGEEGCVKVLDFGVSCFESHVDYRADDPGTYRWMAPEMLCHKPYTRKVDVYSFGIVLWEMLTVCVPYEEMSAVQAAFCVLHKKTRPPIPLDCPPILEDLLHHCWSEDPDRRPEFWEILRTLNLCEQSLVGASHVMTLESPEHYRCLPLWLQTE